jgi:ABC-type phosphate/phosphonate transport system substrate-binding protein
MLRKLFVACGAVAALVAPAAARAPAEIHFGIISTESTQALKER